MTTAVQRRRGTSTEHSTFTGLDGEITVNTTTYTAHIHDGATVGGVPLAKADGSNIVTSSIDINGGTIDGTVIGGTTPAAVTTTALVATTADINGGTIDGTVIGGSTAAAGTFTTITGSGDMAIDTNTLFVDASENRVGMGISTPDFPLHLQLGASSAYTEVAFNHPSGSSGLGAKVYLSGHNNPTIRGVVLDAEKLGGNAHDFHIYTNSSGVAPTKAITIANNNDISFYEDTGTTAKLTWSASDERLGIGTSSPATVSGGIHAVHNSAEGTPTGIGDEVGIFQRNFNSSQSVAVSLISGSASTSNIYFGDNSDIDAGKLSWSNSTNSFSFSGGNVGIGTSSPVTLKSATTLQVDGNAKLGDDNGRGLLSLGDISSTGANVGIWRGAAGAYAGTGNYLNLGGYDGITFTTGNADIDSQTEAMRIDSSGNLLVGKTNTLVTTLGTSVQANGFCNIVANQASPADGPQVSFANIAATVADGYKFCAFRINAAATQVGSISTNGSSSVSYNTSSDQRLKENITDAPAGNIDDIKVRSFDWKVDGSHQDYGMVAQELEAVAPYAVTKGETEDDMWSVDYSKLVPMLIKEIQDLKAEVAALKGAN